MKTEQLNSTIESHVKDIFTAECGHPKQRQIVNLVKRLVQEDHGELDRMERVLDMALGTDEKERLQSIVENQDKLKELESSIEELKMIKFSLSEVVAELKTATKDFDEHPSFDAIARAEALLNPEPTSEVGKVSEIVEIEKGA